MYKRQLLHYPLKLSVNRVLTRVESNPSGYKDEGDRQKTSVTSTAHTSYKGAVSSILLSTAVVTIQDNRGGPQLCRVLLDSGSQSNFITNKTVKKLGLPTRTISSEVSGIGQSITNPTRIVQCIIKSRFNSFSTAIDCLVLSSITQQLPTISIDRSSLDIPPNLQLADPQFSQPGDIDLLIGAELFFDLLCEGRFKICDSTPTLQNTVFGWIISGKIKVNQKANSTSVCHLSTHHDINKIMQRFWDLEDHNGEKQYTGNDKFCKDLFMQTTTRDEHGRYCVQLPLKGEVSELGESKDIALRRFLLVEKRLLSNPDLQRQYVNFMREYEELGHMREITSTEAEQSKAYYIPCLLYTSRCV